MKDRENKAEGDYIHVVPLEWLNRIPLNRLARTVVFLLWQCGVQRTSRNIKASNEKAKCLGLSRYAKSRGLKQLEKLGVIRIYKLEPGKAFTVELIGYEECRRKLKRSNRSDTTLYEKTRV